MGGAVASILRWPHAWVDVAVRTDDMLTRREELWANVRGMGLVVASSPLLTLVLLGLTGIQGVAPALVVAETGRFLAGLPQAIRLGPGSSAAADVRGALELMAGAILVSQVFGPVQEAVLFGLQASRYEDVVEPT